MPVGLCGPNKGGGSKGGGEEPPQDQTPREEERVPNAGGPVWPERFARRPQGRRRGAAAVR